MGGRVSDLDDVTVTSLKRAILDRDRQIDELRQSNNNLLRLMQHNRQSAENAQVGYK